MITHPSLFVHLSGWFLQQIPSQIHYSIVCSPITLVLPINSLLLIKCYLKSMTILVKQRNNRQRGYGYEDKVPWLCRAAGAEDGLWWAVRIGAEHRQVTRLIRPQRHG